MSVRELLAETRLDDTCDAVEDGGNNEDWPIEDETNSGDDGDKAGNLKEKPVVGTGDGESVDVAA